MDDAGNSSLDSALQDIKTLEKDIALAEYELRKRLPLFTIYVV